MHGRALLRDGSFFVVLWPDAYLCLTMKGPAEFTLVHLPVGLPPEPDSADTFRHLRAGRVCGQGFSTQARRQKSGLRFSATARRPDAGGICANAGAHTFMEAA
jgi:hypothetical protein